MNQVHMVSLQINGTNQRKVVAVFVTRLKAEVYLNTLMPHLRDSAIIEKCAWDYAIDGFILEDVTRWTG